MISKACLEMIKYFEGFRPNAYMCSSGVPTIGFGHTKNVHMNDVCTLEQAEVFLKSDLKTHEKAVDNLPYKLNIYQREALISFSFNCGIGNLKKLADDGNRSLYTVYNKIILYNKSAGRTLKGLERRRAIERNYFDIPNAISTYNVEAAIRVIAGKYGNGDSRKNKLESEGYDYEAVRTIVNRLLRGVK